ncbi:hypothetical protein P7K49_001356 [Saguinus oedipus]|uniref:Uncharacterized protein n=1 Tax=Saguinus oedipus TaxID=9490 RepID=A0ABQ9WEV0_SAGOE|nr:hypothetical protein P7K49_001356 [Saguinus oedipus]
MEADEVTEEPHTTVDAKEHPSSKDPSSEDLRENHISESFLEPSTSETPLEPHISESPLVPTPSETPLVANSSETHQEPSISETLSEIPTYEASLDSPISVVPKKHLTLPPQSVDYVSLLSSETLKEDLSSESSSNEVPWTRRSTHLTESESLPEHSLSGPSAQVQMDASEKQKEEAGETEKGVDASGSTAHTAQHGYQLDKKKEKKGVSRYTARPVVPAKQAELVEVAKAMHKEKFSAQVNNLFQWKKDAALNAIQTEACDRPSSNPKRSGNLNIQQIAAPFGTGNTTCLERVQASGPGNTRVDADKKWGDSYKAQIQHPESLQTLKQRWPRTLDSPQETCCSDMTKTLDPLAELH